MFENLITSTLRPVFLELNFIPLFSVYPLPSLIIIILPLYIYGTYLRCFSLPLSFIFPFLSLPPPPTMTIADINPSWTGRGGGGAYFPRPPPVLGGKLTCSPVALSIRSRMGLKHLQHFSRVLVQSLSHSAFPSTAQKGRPCISKSARSKHRYTRSHTSISHPPHRREDPVSVRQLGLRTGTPGLTPVFPIHHIEGKTLYQWANKIYAQVHRVSHQYFPSTAQKGRPCISRPTRSTHRYCFASSPRRPYIEDKRMVLEHTHGLFIT